MPNASGTLGPTSASSGGFNISDWPVNVDTDTIYELELYTAFAGGGYPFAATASMDPMIAVPAGYGLLFSNGIGNGPATGSVPQPGTLGLLGAALIGMAAARRRLPHL